MSVPSQSFYLINVLSDVFWRGDMIMVNQYTWAMFFIDIIEEVVIFGKLFLKENKRDQKRF